VKLTTHLQLAPKSRIRGSIHTLPHTSLWRSALLLKHRDNFLSFLTSSPFQYQNKSKSFENFIRRNNRTDRETHLPIMLSFNSMQRTYNHADSDLPGVHVRRDGSVGIAASYDLDGQISNPGRGTTFFSSPVSRPAVGSTQPPIQWVPRALSPGEKRQGREADHSPPSSAEVKKIGAVPPLLHKSSWQHA
jgi:hypothetical protein